MLHVCLGVVRGVARSIHALVDEQEGETEEEDHRQHQPGPAAPLVRHRIVATAVRARELAEINTSATIVVLLSFHLPGFALHSLLGLVIPVTEGTGVASRRGLSGEGWWASDW